MKTFKIICFTDGYHAARYAGFSRDGRKTEAERLTLNITPNAKHVIQIDVPPFDMSGSGCPETGNTPVVMAMWK